MPVGVPFSPYPVPTGKEGDVDKENDGELVSEKLPDRFFLIINIAFTALVLSESSAQ